MVGNEITSVIIWLENIKYPNHESCDFNFVTTILLSNLVQSTLIIRSWISSQYYKFNFSMTFDLKFDMWESKMMMVFALIYELTTWLLISTHIRIIICAHLYFNQFLPNVIYFHLYSQSNISLVAWYLPLT